MDNTGKDTPLITRRLRLGLTLGTGIGIAIEVAPDRLKQEGEDSEDE